MNDLVTPEQIAREAAEALVRVEQVPDERLGAAWAVYLGPPGQGYEGDRDDEPRAREMGRRLAADWVPIFLAAVERALVSCPVPSPVGEERLKAARWFISNGPPHGHSGEYISDLLAHIDHLHRILRGTEADAYAQGFDAGLREGAKRQREADVAELSDDHLTGTGLAVALGRLVKSPLAADSLSERL